MATLRKAKRSFGTVEGGGLGRGTDPAYRYQPMNDRVLLREIVEEEDGLVVTPDAYKQSSNKGTVVAVGEGMVIGGVLRPINLKPGDVVLFGEFGAEPLELDGQKYKLVSAFDIRLKL